MRSFARLMLTALLVAFAASHLVDRTRARRTELFYSAFLAKVTARDVRSVTVGRDTAKGTLAGGERFFCRIPRNDPQLYAFLRQAHVPCAVAAEPFERFWGRAAFLLAPLPVVFLVLWLGMRQAGKRVGDPDEEDFAPLKRPQTEKLDFGPAILAELERALQKERKRRPGKATEARAAEPRPSPFDWIGGLEEAKEQLREIADFLREPEKYQSLGAKIPKGVLLVGPPGCGKTLLMRAMADEIDIPQLHADGSEFDGVQVGLGAKRVRGLFAAARSKRPCLLFIDHLDALGADRRAPAKPDRPLPNQTAYELAAQMDGFERNVGVVVLAATHRPDLVDPLLLRAGRFDRTLRIDKPDAGERSAILRLHAVDKPLREGVDLAALAEQTEGMTGADLANLVNEAAIAAARAGKQCLDGSDFDVALQHATQARQVTIGQ
jgi:cell division protease FtsH